jgi:hypothetical protein
MQGEEGNFKGNSVTRDPFYHLIKNESGVLDYHSIAIPARHTGVVYSYVTVRRSAQGQVRYVYARFAPYINCRLT